MKASTEEWSDRLLGLQHGDSFFPGGAIALSAGLETLVNDGERRHQKVNTTLFAAFLWTMSKPLKYSVHGIS